MEVQAGIGIVSFVAGFVVGRWWFAVGTGVVVAIVVAIGANDEISPVFVGCFLGGAVGFAMYIGTVLRWGLNWVVQERRDRKP
jgi:hypothetical protein